MGKVGKALLIFDLIVVHVAVVFVVWKTVVNRNEANTLVPTPRVVSLVTSNNNGTQTQYIDTCGSECKQAVDFAVSSVSGRINELAQLVAVLPSPKTASTTTTTTTTKTKVKSTTYLPIPGSGNTTLNDWATLTGTEFYFDTRDYPGLIEVYFEANMALLNGNGMAYVRLYDSTHGIGVSGSELQTNSQASTAVSSAKLNFWAGKNLMSVQAKSLTADTTVYSAGRLKIVTEN